VRNEAIAFAEKITGGKKTSIYLDDATAVMGLERMLVLKYATKTHIDPRLVAVIQKLNVKFLFPSKNTSKRLFSMLISHAISSKPDFREDVLRQLTFALELDSGYFALWRELYPKFIAHSYNLLLLIADLWQKENLSQQISGAELAATVKHFVTVNDQLSKGEFIDKNAKKPRKATNKEATEISLCTATCKALLSKLKPYAKSVDAGSASSNAGSAITTLTILVVAGAGAYYTFVNCCNLDWCRSFALSNPALNDILHC